MSITFGSQRPYFGIQNHAKPVNQQANAPSFPQTPSQLNTTSSDQLYFGSNQKNKDLKTWRRGLEQLAQVGLALVGGGTLLELLVSCVEAPNCATIDTTQRGNLIEHYVPSADRPAVQNQAASFESQLQGSGSFDPGQIKQIARLLAVVDYIEGHGLVQKCLNDNPTILFPNSGLSNEAVPSNVTFTALQAKGSKQLLLGCNPSMLAANPTDLEKTTGKLTQLHSALLKLIGEYKYSAVTNFSEAVGKVASACAKP